MQIEPGHLQTAVRIPGPAGTHIEQPGPSLGEYLAAINEVQANLFAGTQWLGKDDRNQIIAAPRQLRAFERLVVNELHRAAVRLDLADLQEAGQFEEHGALPALSHLQLHEGFGIEPGGRRYVGLDLVLRNVDCFGLRFFSHDAGGVAGAAAGLAQGECAPHVVVTFTVDRLLLARPDLFRGQGVEVKVESPKRPSLKPRMQHAIIVGRHFGFRGVAALPGRMCGRELLKLRSSRKASS